MTHFQEFSDQAKIWIYQSDKPFTEEVKKKISEKLSEFVEEWSAHGTKLKASGLLLDEFRIALCADKDVEASGCSIDSSVRFIKLLGEEFQLNFFNRLQILTEENGNRKLIHFSQLKDHPELLMFHPSPKNLGEFRIMEKLPVQKYFSL